jgi:Skp family chaperone for outer membrane proteins
MSFSRLPFGSAAAVLAVAAVAGAGLLVLSPVGAIAQPAAAPAAAPAGSASRVATVDVYKISARLVGTDIYIKKMEARRDELKKRIDPMDKELRDLADRLKAFGPDNKSPEADAAAKMFQAKQQDLLKLSQGLDREMDTFVTLTNFEAYQQVVREAQALAKAKGFTYLIASRPSDDTTPPASAGAFMQSIMSRPVLMSPADADLTAELFKLLKLEEAPSSAPAAAAPAGQGAAPAAPANPSAPTPGGK